MSIVETFRIKARAAGLLFSFLAAIALAAGPFRSAAAGEGIPFPGKDPGKAEASLSGKTFRLGDGALAAVFDLSEGRFRYRSLENGLSGEAVGVPGEVFTVVLSDGGEIGASAMTVTAGPEIRSLPADPAAPRLAERLPGFAVALELVHEPTGLKAAWRGILRDGANDLRQEVVLEAGGKALPLQGILWFRGPLPGARVAGTVKGSPVTARGLFLGVEHPMARSAVEKGVVTCALDRGRTLEAGRTFASSFVIGVVPEGQTRRGFLYYLERERAHPYRTSLHYNSWYDIGYFSKYGEADCLAVIDAFGGELFEKRRVVLDSFLLDDGWDDLETLWGFHGGFPRGFAPLKERAAKYGAGLGVWLSPWGGYGEPRKKRLAFGKRAGFEINKSGFALSGPKYYKRFLEICLKMIRDYGVNQFKFDGIGRNTAAAPGSAFGSDFEAAIALIRELRKARPDIYINLTTGTWPSPFWLEHADSIWRGGYDHGFAGVGSDRQRWITYRDAMTYANIVEKGPLFPLSSLMLHGMIFARHAGKLSADPGNDFAAEVFSFFGSGTQLQEMYITPALLEAKDWDVLARAARWSRRNAGVLRDTHWVGGDPEKLEVYGWASWSPGKGILVLRNPSDKAAAIAVDVGEVFELPAGAAREFAFTRPFSSGAAASLTVRAGEKRRFVLEPFEVLVCEARPG